jgi:2-polyprenyl-3-methyl-5-hydroxy-6-metoxy-1,4-benzoquinol methylase
VASIRGLTLKQRVVSITAAGSGRRDIYRAFHRVVRRLDLDGDLLDFGSKTGTMAAYFHKIGRFKSVAAVDGMPRPAELDAAVTWVSTDLNARTSFPDEAFDVVVAAEVIELLENPRAAVREWFRLLRLGGTLVFSAPNNESWRSLATLVFDGHFADFRERSYPAHISALLRKDIEHLLSEIGFSSPTFDFTDAGGIPKIPRIHWQTISAGLLTGLRFSDNLIAIARKT